MRRFKKILFVNEPGTVNSTTPQAAIDLARANGASVTFCDVAQELPRSLTNLEKTFKKLRMDRIQDLLKDVDHSDISVDMKLLEGTAFIEIIREVQIGRYDLLIKDVEADGRLGSRFGSIDLHLMRKCPCPVWIANSETLGEYQSILAAVDVDPTVAANPELNKLILDLAISLVQESSSKLHIVHAWSVVHESLLRDRRMNFETDKLEDTIEQTRRTRVNLVDELLGQWDLSSIDYETHIEKDSASNLILSLAAKHHVDLVVMGTVARTGIAGFFIGNTAEKILNNIECSALTVKPSGFNTPINQFVY